MIFMVICLLAICIGAFLGIWVAAYVFMDENIIKRKNNETPIKEETYKNKVNERFTDDMTGLSDDMMENMTDEQAEDYAENERKTQTGAYDYAARK